VQTWRPRLRIIRDTLGGQHRAGLEINFGGLHQVQIGEVLGGS